MNDLNQIYREHALSGIVPQALRPGSGGYRFLARRIREGDPFWILRSRHSDLPLTDLSLLTPVTPAFTTREQAEEYLLARNAAGGWALQSVEGQKPRAGVLRDLWDLGIQALRFDDAAEIGLPDILPSLAGDEDSASTRVMGAGILLLNQRVRDGLPADHLFLQTVRMLALHPLYLPLQVTGGGNGPLTEDDFTIPFLSMANGEAALAMCTSLPLLDLGLRRDRDLAAVFPRFLYWQTDLGKVLEILSDHPGLVLSLNPGTASLTIPLDLLCSALERISAGELPEPAGDTDFDRDPTPDFLRGI